MTQPLNDTTQKITKIVAQLLEKDETLLTPATPLKDLGIGEFDLIELIMKLEDQFSLIIDDADKSEIYSIESAVQFIAAKK
jgi:acyl carrier protein